MTKFNNNQKTALLVEDNPKDEQLTLRALNKNGLGDRVDVVRDGAEALDFLFCEGEYKDRDNMLPSVVLLDLKLPKISGLEVLKKIRSDNRTKNLPVVVLSSSDEKKDISASYDLNVNSFVCKPVNYTTFSEVVAKLGVYWLQVNQIPSMEL
ncbi:MAG: response regulator [Magnetococcales bacterium]|nr:response regulator [Magnetococcales bacterium]